MNVQKRFYHAGSLIILVFCTFNFFLNSIYAGNDIVLNNFFFIIANCEKIRANALEAAQNADIPTEVSVIDASVNKSLKNSTAETYNSNKKRKKSVESMIFFVLLC